jgi:glycosyltransferase involved in cell wall biosynthesis
MDIVYVCNSQIPSRSTNSMQIMRMCAAFAESGADVTLVHSPSRSELPEGWSGDLCAFYGVAANFAIVELPTGLRPENAKRRWISRGARLRALWRYQVHRSAPPQSPYVWYGRSFLGALLAIVARHLWLGRSSCRAIVVELHDEPASAAEWRILRHVDAVVTISQALRQRVVAYQPRLEKRVWVEHDGADVEAVSQASSGTAQAARVRLGISRAEGPVIVYTGRVNSDKGADLLLDAMDDLRPSGAVGVLVGKVYDASFLERASDGNVHFTGFVPPAQVPAYLAAADILVLPTRPRLSYSAYMSPLKLFEYMAARRPIVATDIPVLREVLQHERNALLFRPDDPRSLADQISRLWSDPGLQEQLVAQAWQDVRSYAWPARARRIASQLTSIAEASVT